MRSIGGDFGFDPRRLSGEDRPLARAIFPSCGRAALYHTLVEACLGVEDPVLLVPDYTCPSVPAAATLAGVTVVPYPVGTDLRLDRAAFDAGRVDAGQYLLLNSYFGLVGLEEDVDWARTHIPGVVVIEDDSQAPFSLGHSVANYAFTSYRKAFAVADGADVSPRLKRTFDTGRIESFVLAWSLGAITKHLAQTDVYPDEAYLRLFETAARQIDTQLDFEAAMSQISWGALPGAMAGVAERRRANFEALREFLEPLGLHSLVELSEDSVPLFLPVMIERRDEVRKRLMEKRIYCPVHWPEQWAHERSGAMCSMLHDRELSLVIDQRYDTDDMRRVAQELEAAGVKAFVAD